MDRSPKVHMSISHPLSIQYLHSPHSPSLTYNISGGSIETQITARLLCRVSEDSNPNPRSVSAGDWVGYNLMLVYWLLLMIISRVAFIHLHAYSLTSQSSEVLDLSRKSCTINCKESIYNIKISINFVDTCRKMKEEYRKKN